MIPTNIETGEPQINIIFDKYQDNYNIILNNAVSDVKWNQIPDTDNEIGSPILGQLYDGIWVN